MRYLKSFLMLTLVLVALLAFATPATHAQEPLEDGRAPESEKAEVGEPLWATFEGGTIDLNSKEGEVATICIMHDAKTIECYRDAAGAEAAGHAVPPAPPEQVDELGCVWGAGYGLHLYSGTYYRSPSLVIGHRLCWLDLNGYRNWASSLKNFTGRVVWFYDVTPSRYWVIAHGIQRSTLGSWDNDIDLVYIQ